MLINGAFKRRSKNISEKTTAEFMQLRTYVPTALLHPCQGVEVYITIQGRAEWS
jgi:hypothetical protein